MRCESENDRMEKPECCDNCGVVSEELTRREHYGPGIQIDWECEYCSNLHLKDTCASINLANMMHVLEARLTRKIKALVDEGNG